MAKTPKTETYWRDTFSVTEEDDLALQQYFSEHGAPLPLSAIARVVVQQQLAADASANAGHYDPQGTFRKGETLIFPRRNNAVGEVVSVRDGQNPRYDDFQVIGVRFEGQKAVREFVANAPSIQLRGGNGSSAPRLSENEIFARYEATILETTQAALEDSGEYATDGDLWIPQALLPTIHEGHLNIAEAMIEMVGSSLTSADLLPELDIADGDTPINRFALNQALRDDARFSNAGSADAPAWTLNK
jgi:hypothetical protein